jgi:DNA-binding MarR family transcriptional regulator
VDAVRCALDVQERIAAVNEDIPAERRVVFRIGVHVGEVMVRNGDIFGDGVNIAARMEKIARPGLVCISGAAYEYAHKVLPLTFEDLGPQTVKNVSVPIRAYLISPSGGLPSRSLPPVHRHNEFNLGRRFHRVLSVALEDVVKPESLTTAEPSVFASLHDAPQISERRLANRIGMDPAGVRRMLRHLERRGLVCRSVGHRGVHVFALTPAGLELYERLHLEILAVRDRVMAPLSERERETLRELMARVIAANEVQYHPTASPIARAALGPVPTQDGELGPI